MRAKWEIPLTLGVLIALAMWAKPHLGAQPTSPSGDVVVTTIRTLQTQTIGGVGLIVAVAIVGAFAWWSITQERKLNGCLGPVASVVLGVVALWLLYMLGG
ncbi:hypothetical protein GC175_22825, partial [bacterium]|nr:hypothetical protein [bacterium]